MKTQATMNLTSFVTERKKRGRGKLPTSNLRLPSAKHLLLNLSRPNDRQALNGYKSQPRNRDNEEIRACLFKMPFKVIFFLLINSLKISKLW
jgi:hypothetical protein